MRIGKLLVMAVALCALVPGGASATSFPSTCPSATTVADGVTPGTVDPGDVAKFKFSVPSGSAGQVVMYGAGDIDMVACKPGTSVSSARCYSHNSAGVPDLCADEGLEGPQGFGPHLPPGTWTIMVNHCTDIECGYPADAPAPLPFVLVTASV